MKVSTRFMVMFFALLIMAGQCVAANEYYVCVSPQTCPSGSSFTLPSGSTGCTTPCVYTCTAGSTYCPSSPGSTTCTTACQSYYTCASSQACPPGNTITLSNGTTGCKTQCLYYCASGQYCPVTNAVDTVSCTLSCLPYTLCQTGQTCNGTLLSNNGCTGTCNGSLACTGDSQCNPWQTCSGGNCIYPVHYEPVEWAVPVSNVKKTITKLQLNSSLNPPKTSPYFILNPLLQFPSLTGIYDFYALIVDYTGMYVARTDRIGNIIFVEYIPGDKIRSYQTMSFQNGLVLNSWSFGNVFEELMRELRLSQQGCFDGNYRFYLGVAPAGTDISTSTGISSLYAVEFYCNQP